MLSFKFLLLPTELQLLIIQTLDLDSCLKISQTCQYLNQLINYELFKRLKTLQTKPLIMSIYCANHKISSSDKYYYSLLSSINNNQVILQLNELKLSKNLLNDYTKQDIKNEELLKDNNIPLLINEEINNIKNSISMYDEDYNLIMEITDKVSKFNKKPIYHDKNYSIDYSLVNKGMEPLRNGYDYEEFENFDMQINKISINGNYLLKKMEFS